MKSSYLSFQKLTVCLIALSLLGSGCRSRTEEGESNLEATKEPFAPPSKSYLSDIIDKKYFETSQGNLFPSAFMTESQDAEAIRQRINLFDLLMITYSPIGFIATKLPRLWMRNWDSNKLPMFTFKGVLELQGYVFAGVEPKPEAEFVMPYKGSSPAGKQYKAAFKENNCTIAKPKEINVPSKLGVYTVEEELDADIFVKCINENSRVLSETINQLSNSLSGRKLTVQLTDSEGKKLSSSNFEEFSEGLFKMGFSVEIATMSTLADMLGYSVKTAEGMKRLRTLSWFKVQLGQSFVEVPAQHGEFVILLHKNGKVHAMTRWFLGLPTKGIDAQAALWRPMERKRPKWAGYRIDRVEKLDASKSIKLAHWLHAAQDLMRGFNVIQMKYEPVWTSYGMFVCSDSAALLMAAMESKYPETLREAFPVNEDGRRSSIFPVIRMSRIAKPEDVDDILVYYSGIKRDILTKTYAPDLVVEENNSVLMKKRLRSAFPDHPYINDRLKAVPEFVNGDLKTIRNP